MEQTKIPASDSEFFSIKITQNTENLGFNFTKENYELCYKLIERKNKNLKATEKSRQSCDFFIRLF